MELGWGGQEVGKKVVSLQSYFVMAESKTAMESLDNQGDLFALTNTEIKKPVYCFN